REGGRSRPMPRPGGSEQEAFGYAAFLKFGRGPNFVSSVVLRSAVSHASATRPPSVTVRTVEAAITSAGGSKLKLTIESATTFPMVASILTSLWGGYLAPERVHSNTSARRDAMQ